MEELLHQRQALVNALFLCQSADPGTEAKRHQPEAEAALGAFDRAHPAVFSEACRRYQAQKAQEPPRPRDPWEI